MKQCAWNNKLPLSFALSPLVLCYKKIHSINSQMSMFTGLCFRTCGSFEDTKNEKKIQANELKSKERGKFSSWVLCHLLRKLLYCLTSVSLSVCTIETWPGHLAFCSQGDRIITKNCPWHFFVLRLTLSLSSLVPFVLWKVYFTCINWRKSPLCTLFRVDELPTSDLCEFVSSSMSQRGRRRPLLARTSAERKGRRRMRRSGEAC